MSRPRFVLAATVAALLLLARAALAATLLTAGDPVSVAPTPEYLLAGDLTNDGIYDPKEDSDGTRIVITRKWPIGQKKDRFDEWIRDLSPEEDTLNKLDDSKKTEEGWKR